MNDDTPTPLYTLAASYDYDPMSFESDVDEAVRKARVAREAKRLVAEEDAPGAEMPEAIDLATRMLKPREEVKWRVKDWLPTNGRVLILAQGKAGKSHSAHNLVRSMVNGDLWLGKWKPTVLEGNVTILDFELSEPKIEEWLHKQGVEDESRVVLISFRGKAGTFNILDPVVRRQWAEVLAGQGTDYVILDCLRPVMDALGLDEHKDAGRFLIAFDALLKEAGVAEGALIHHMGHGGERSRGDSRIIDWPDVIWTMTLDNVTDPASARYIRAYGRDVEVPEHKLTLDKRTGHLTAEESERGNEEAEVALAAVLSVLGECSDPVTTKAIEKELAETDVRSRDVKYAVRIGVRRGLIEQRDGRHGSFLYTLPRSWARRMGGGYGEEE